MALASRGGTALPIWVYLGTSLSHIPSSGFPALRGPPVVLGPQKRWWSGNVWSLAHSLTLSAL
ncbi:uncharacterized protein METZ01_LOCUS352764, partial [marine metagenome]